MDDIQINHWSINLKINNLRTTLGRYFSVENYKITDIHVRFKSVIKNFAKHVISDNWKVTRRLSSENFQLSKEKKRKQLFAYIQYFIKFIQN